MRPRRADEADVRDVEERRDPHAGAVDDELPQPRQRQRTRRARVVPRRHARDRGDRIGVDAPVGHLVEDVRVQVDEARA